MTEKTIFCIHLEYGFLHYCFCSPSAPLLLKFSATLSKHPLEVSSYFACLWGNKAIISVFLRFLPQRGATCNMPDLNDDPDRESYPTFLLYAIVGTCESWAQSQACLSFAEMKQRSHRQAANTVCIPNLSTDEKRADKAHRNINRRVSPSVFVVAVSSSKSPWQNW